MTGTQTKYIKDAEIFWDNGKFVAVVTDVAGTRRNIAPYNCQTKQDARQAVREWLDYEHEYQIAFVMESGDFDIVETFAAIDDDAANRYAGKHYAGQEWYVLHHGDNING